LSQLDLLKYNAFNMDEIPEDLELLCIGEKDRYLWQNDQPVKKKQDIRRTDGSHESGPAAPHDPPRNP